ncbi:MAG: beta-lactamase family protein [Planctomycetales bacterium]|nr:beta-lactamase family protein [Planctomycetales bacterium]
MFGNRPFALFARAADLPRVVLLALFAPFASIAVVLPASLAVAEVPASGTAQEALTAEEARQIEGLFSRVKADEPGCAVGVVRNGRLIHAANYGLASLEQQTPLSSKSLFEVGSFSKTFTAVCVAMLVDEGRVALDDDVRKYVPQLHSFNPPIRIKHLLQCRTGLYAQYHIMPLAGYDNLPVPIPFSREDALAVLLGQTRLPFEPGSEFRYGSTDYFVLGEVVRQVTGKPLDVFARERLFAPLGMTSTRFEADPGQVTPLRAECHLAQGKAEWRRWRNVSYFVGGSGLLTCVEDLAAWERALNERRLPRGALMDEFLETGAVIGNANVLTVRPVAKYRGLKRLSGTGGVFGASSSFMRFPDRQTAIICLANRDDLAPWELCEQVADVLLANQLEPRAEVLDKAWSGQAWTIRAKQDDDRWSELVGDYQFDNGQSVWRIESDRDVLQLVDHLGKRTALRPARRAVVEPPAESLPNSPDRVRLNTFRGEFGGMHDDESIPVLVEFRQQDKSSPIEMRYQQRGQSTWRLLRIDSFQPTKEELRRFEGRFESAEIHTRYEFRVRDGRLHLRVNGRRWEPLDPTAADLFVPSQRTPHDQRFFQFVRDSGDPSAGSASKVKVSFWRVRDLEFQRVD